MNLKEKVCNALKSHDGYREFYSRHFPNEINEDGSKDQFKVRCRFHNDTNPSLSINVSNGLYHCFGCGVKGNIFDFRMRLENLIFPQCLEVFADELGVNVRREKSVDIESERTPSIAHVTKWSEGLFMERCGDVRRFLNDQRGLHDTTLRKFLIGFNPERQSVCIPILDTSGKTVSAVKYIKYDLLSGEKSLTTHGKAQLLGLNWLIKDYAKHNQVIITEGELDAMVLNQYGFLAVSGTAGASTWKDEWKKHFEGKNVVVCCDSDEAGRRGAAKVVDAIVGIASSVKKVDLFGESASKEMKDVTDYFVKAGKTAEDFRKMVEQAKICLAKIDGISSKLYRALTTASSTKEVNPAQDCTEGVFSYAVRIQGQLYVLTSDRGFLQSKGQSDHSIKFNGGDVDLCRFSGQGILEFLNGQRKVNPFELFGEIKNYIRRYVVLKGEQAYAFLTLWTMGTYVFRVFRYYPYVHLNGPKQSGKTLLMEILEPICFNGQLSVNATEAVLFRDVQNNSLTQFLDEVERFKREDRERYGAVMDVLKTGFSKSGLVKRCGGKNKDKILSFSTYSPKMFAGINEIEDVLRDRTIRVRMVRRLQGERVERYVEKRSTQEFQHRVRDDLYNFGLTFGPEIAEVYTENIESIPGLELLDNRAFDMWAPIMLLANVVDVGREDGAATIRDAMVDFSKRCSEDRAEDDESDNDTVKLLTVLNQMVAELSPLREDRNIRCFDTGQAFEYFREQDEFSWLQDKNKGWLTKKLKSIEILVGHYKNEGKTKKMYEVDSDKLLDYSNRYLPPTDESVTVTESVTSQFAECEPK